ncbi:Olfactory receptor 2G3 [Lemmus lemmus]
MLVNFGGPNKIITYHGCATQLYIFLWLGATECVLLVVMAVDRYVAVCHPLRYTTVMHPKVCGQLAVLAWGAGLIQSLIQSSATLRLPFCSHRVVDDIVCEVPALIQLSSADTTYNEVQMSIASVILLVLPLVIILSSYAAIVKSVLKIKSTAGQKKAFGTCTSHLLVVSLFYGTVTGVYLQPKTHYAHERGKFLTLFYTVVTPTLNPLIYTLRNKEVKGAVVAGMINSSVNDDFILVGFSDQPELERRLFVVILISYLLTLVGNAIIILISSIDPKLKTPMYFFLTHLSLVDICFTTSIVPQLLWNLKGPAKTITAVGCAVQLYVSLTLGSTECILLAVMAFDRYAAVCKPLHYAAVMNPQLCRALAGISWISGLGNALIQGTVTLWLPRCGHLWLHHFFCEVPSMIKLACVDIHANEVQLFVASLVLLLLPLALILTSYGYIVKTVMRIKSAQAWQRALGTCGSHLMVVSLFYGSITAIYIQPNSSYAHTHGKFISLFYTVMTPALNPLIYTLRNKEVKGALRRLFNRGSGVCK